MTKEATTEVLKLFKGVYGVLWQGMNSNEPQKVRLRTADGFAGRFLVNEKLRFQLYIERKKANFHVFKVWAPNGDKPVIPLQGTDKDDDWRAYDADVTVQLRPTTQAIFIDHNKTNLRILKLNADTGQFQLRESGLFTQNGNFFVCGIKTREGRVYLQAGRQVCPDVGNWPKMEEFILKWLKPDISLPDISERVVTEHPSASRSGEARIQWFNPWLGYGIATLHDGTPARVHHSRAEIGINELFFPKPGDIVKYVQVLPSNETGKLPELTRVTFLV